MRLLLESIAVLYLMVGLAMLVRQFTIVPGASPRYTSKQRCAHYVGMMISAMGIIPLWPLMLAFQSHLDECSDCRKKIARMFNEVY
jgi:hypothetical protein